MRTEILRANYERVLARAAAAARRAGRDPSSVRLVAVTKSVTAEVAAALIDMGAADLGENRVANLLDRQAALADRPARWHMIGQLQRNKARKIVGRVALIHSVDSTRLAEEIGAVARRDGVVQEVLLEANVSGEKSKLGFAAVEARAAAAAIGEMPAVRLAGLMTMAPLSADAEVTRPVFRALKELGDAIAADGHFAGADYELSMGMTQDFEVAIEEGATLIRVGSALFEGIEGEEDEADQG